MALLIRKVIVESQWNSCIQFVRHGHRINIQRPRAPHYARAKVLHVCKPYSLRLEEKPMPEMCLKPIEIIKKKKEIENPYQILVGKELLSWFDQSQMILFYHQNPIKSEDLFKARILFRRQDMYLRSYSKHIAVPALEGTKYEAVLELFNDPVAMVFSPEPKVAKCLKINKKTPQLILLAGIIENRFLSKNELVEYSRLPDLQTAQAQLVATLNSAASQIVYSMSYHQQTLVGHLQKHIELQTPESKTQEENKTEDS